jgi:hypothetical protein
MSEWMRVGLSALVQLRALSTWARPVGRHRRPLAAAPDVERRLCDRFFGTARVSPDEVCAVRRFCLSRDQIAMSAARAMEAALRGERRNFVRLVEALEWAAAAGHVSVRELGVCKYLRAHFAGRESQFLRLRSACALLFISAMLVPSDAGIGRAPSE